MNEQQIADKLADIMDAQISKVVEPLHLQIAALTQRNTDLATELETLNGLHNGLHNDFNDLMDSIDKADAQITVDFDEVKASIVGQRNRLNVHNDKLTVLSGLPIEFEKEMLGINDTVTESELRLLAALDAHKSDVNAGLEEFNIEVDENLTSNYKTTLEKQCSDLDEAIEKLRLNSVNQINAELLRLNDHVNTKLTTLKGEKGEPGEKGNEGDNGFLSGVSIWKTGHISKRDEAVTHSNSLWLCLCEQTAQEPGCGDDYQLLNDGIKTISLADDNQLTLTMGSDKQIDLGYVGFSFKGDYSDKAAYAKNDLVVLNGTTFISLSSDNSNRPPSNTWKAFVKRGPKGSPGEKGDEGKAYNFDANAFMDDVTAVIDSVVDKKIKVQ